MRVHTSADHYIAVKIEDEQDPEKPVIVYFRPLTYAQRKEILSCIAMKGGNMIEDRMEMVRLAIRYSVKSIEGLETASGPYSVKYEPDGFLSQETLDDIFNTDQRLVDAISLGAIKLSNGGPFTELTGDDDDQLEGVTVLTGKKEKSGN